MVNWQHYCGYEGEWDTHISVLGGGFYQSYGWGEVRRVAGWQPLRMLGYHDGKVIVAANVLFKRKFGVAVCWIPGGPLGDSKSLNDVFLAALGRALGTSWFYCRISLLRSNLGSEEIFLHSLGWSRPKFPMSSGFSMSYELSGNEVERLNKTTSNWRHNLKRSQRYGLQIERWENPDFNAIAVLYREMETFKSIPKQHSEAELQALFTNCKDHVVVYRCLGKDGRLLAIRAAGISGLVAMDLLAAAGTDARKVYASHATLWALLGYCYQLGLREYDLSGVDPVGNKGVFDFKHGTGAKLVECLGEWEWGSLPGISSLVNWMIARRGA